MPYYLSPYIGRGGPRQDAWRPVGSEQPGWSAIDLRADGGASRDGGGTLGCLLYLPVHDPDRRLIQLGTEINETRAGSTEAVLKTRLGVATVPGTTLKDTLWALLKEPPNQAFAPLRPNRVGKIEAHLGPKLHEEYQVRRPGGGGDTRPRCTSDPDAMVVDDFLRYPGRRERYLRWFGFTAMLAALAGTGLLSFWECCLLVGALPASDSFTNTTGTQLTTHSSNWTLNDGDFDIQSNALAGDASPTRDNLAKWNADAFDDDQYAAVTVAAITSGRYIGPAVRCGGGGSLSGYDYIIDSADAGYLQKENSGYTLLGSGSPTVSVSDVIRLEASGSTLSALVNGSPASFGDKTDTGLPSGSAGLAASNDDTGSLMDDWTGGNLSVAGIVPLIHYYQARRRM